MWESDARMANTVQCPISLLILSWLWLPWIRFCFCCKSHEKNQSRENFSITYHPSIASPKYLYLWGHFVPSTISPYRVNTITLSSSSSTTLAPFRVGHNQPILNASTQSVIIIKKEPKLRLWLVLIHVELRSERLSRHISSSMHRSYFVSSLTQPLGNWR